jgi:nitroreductase
MSHVSKTAHTEVPISDVIANRYSPRVYDPTHTISDEEVLRLAEAARWAPSGNNGQPWRFAFLKREDATFQVIAETGLSGFNKSWAPRASLLVVAFADKFKADGSAIDRHASYFNNALATAQIVLEAEALGLKSHYMGGIDHEEILRIFGIEDAWVTCVISVGALGDPAAASEVLQQREAAPRERKALTEIVVEAPSK